MLILALPQLENLQRTAGDSDRANLQRAVGESGAASAPQAAAPNPWGQSIELIAKDVGSRFVMRGSGV